MLSSDNPLNSFNPTLNNDHRRDFVLQVRASPQNRVSNLPLLLLEKIPKCDDVVQLEHVYGEKKGTEQQPARQEQVELLEV